MAAGIAHDFNNLLTAISGYSELARRTVEPRSPARLHLQRIAESVTRASKLTRQLLAFSRRSEAEHEPICLRELITNLEPILLHIAGPDVQVDLDLANAQKVVADPGQLEQVLLNLVSNARDAGARRVSISTTDAQVSAGFEGPRLGLAPGDYLALVVADNGSGMDDDTQARVFDPFFTTKHRDGGTGLGLSLAHSVIHQSGGAIEVTSSPGAGTTFRILLPVGPG
jgi:signal transduction histidine kinase